MTGQDAALDGGVRLRAARQARGYSQQQLAGMAGVSLPGYDPARCGEQVASLDGAGVSTRTPGSAGPGQWCGSAG